MSCGFDIIDYSIELVQGDYLSCLYDITDQNGLPLDNVKSIVFTCNRLKVQRELKRLDATTFELDMASEMTSQFSACTCSYDITVLFNNSETPHTIIHNADFTILKKENKLDEQV